MPKIAVFRYFVFYIVAHDLAERYHLHIAKTKGSRAAAAKFWLNPVALFESGNLTTKELNTIEKLLIKNEDALIREINNFAEGRKVKTIQLK